MFSCLWVCEIDRTILYTWLVCSGKYMVYSRNDARNKNYVLGCGICALEGKVWSGETFSSTPNLKYKSKKRSLKNHISTNKSSITCKCLTQQAVNLGPCMDRVFVSFYQICRLKPQPSMWWYLERGPLGSIWVRWDHKWGSHDGMRRRTSRERGGDRSLSPRWLGLKTGRGLTSIWPCWHPYLRLPASRTVSK